MHIQNYLDEVNAIFKLHKKKCRVSLVCCSAASSFHFGDTNITMSAMIFVHQKNRLFWFVVFNATFNNISAISWRSVLWVEETGSTLRKPPTCRKSLTNFITECCIEYTSPWTRFELTTLKVIGTDCTDSCKSNYHDTTMNTWKKNVHVKHVEYFICSVLYVVNLP